MSDALVPSFLRRAAGAAALYVIGVPMIFIGMMLVIAIVAVDKIERRAESAML